MAGWSDSPLFPGKPKNQQANIAASATSTTAIFTADATYGGMVTNIRLIQKEATQRQLRLELKNGSTTTVLSRFLTPGFAWGSMELVSSTYMPVSDTDPKLSLAPGDILQIVAEDTVATNLDVSAIGATFESMV